VHTRPALPRDPATPPATVRLISEASRNPMTARLIAVLEAAATDPTGQARALELGHNYVGCEHLLIGLTVSDGRASELLASQGIVAASLRQALSGALAGIVHERSRPAGPGPGPSAGALADVVRRLDAIERQLAGTARL
jgi:Clp amino terminal domain, pathogenicity island component